MSRPAPVPRTIAVVALPGAQLLDVAGPLDVFAQANQECGRAAYALCIVGLRAGPVRTSSGVALVADVGLASAAGKFDTLLVAGAPDMPSAPVAPALIAWLKAAAPRARRFGSVCTGAFVLAAAKLLDGRRATTHWAAADQLAARHPKVVVEQDAFYVRDGRLRTAAGVTAGLDLALALVEEDLGREVALRVSAQLVMFFKRPGGQLQFSRKGDAGPTGRAVLQELQRWVAAHPALPHSVEKMAERAGMSPRHLARLFRSEIGITPAAWVEATRVAAARALLEAGLDAPKQVAAKCGFANPDTLRRTFVKHVGITPAEFRKRHGVGG